MKQSFASGFVRITAGLYVIIVVDILVLVTCLPLIALVVGTDLTRSWLATALVSPLLAPAVWAAFASFRAHGEGDLAIARVYFRAWRAAWRRIGPYGLAAALLTIVVVVDVQAVAGLALAYAVIPVLAVVTVVAWGTLTLALAATEEFPTLRRLDALKASLYYAIRRGQWTLVSLVIVGTWLAGLMAKPSLALTVATGPVLYVVWANCRAALRPLRERLEPAPVEPTSPPWPVLARVDRKAA
jgi:uncharacterized membrane protein YesL